MNRNRLIDEFARRIFDVITRSSNGDIPDRHVQRGGPGSGHFGHAGRPGEVGGSLPSGQSANGTIPPDIKKRRFFHATNVESEAKSILKSGTVKPGQTEHVSKLTPVEGRAYATQDLEYALIYALGGAMAGHDLPESFFESGQFGYIFEIDQNSLDDIQPDEDSIGEAIYDQRYGWLNKLAKRVLTPRQHSDVMDGFYDEWASAGKKLVGKMTDEQKYGLIRDGAHIANLGELEIKNVWKVDKTKSADFPSRDYSREDTPAERQRRIRQIWSLIEQFDLEEKHYGPGPHPGTGSPQVVHAPNGGGASTKRKGLRISEEYIDRYENTPEAYRQSIERMKELQLEGKFALVTRDQETTEYLLIKDRETAINYMGETIRNNNTETLLGFGLIELLFNKQGKSRSVEINYQEMDEIRWFAMKARETGGDFTLIHNHPETVGVYMPPSPTDILSLLEFHATKMRVYTHDGTYIIRNKRETYSQFASQGVHLTFDEYTKSNVDRRLPELAGIDEADMQIQKANELKLGGKLKQFHLDRLKFVIDKYDWLEYEFIPVE